ncbi:MAG: 4-hydroxy-tetrahydrodipicolinate reductase [Alphaproteobacteria bacterium]|nr:4-hydroxy-tetrahydrodipicolinate reductase [Alphaproteobacteria bacterium]
MKVGVVGGSGRMGQMVVAQVMETPGCVVSGGVEQPGHPLVGKDIGVTAGIDALGVEIGEDAAAMIAAVDVVVDFTIPAATIEHARLAAQAGAAMVIGTTGLDKEQAGVIEAAARHVPIVWAPNMSVGVTLLLALTEQVAGILGPEDYDIEIVEMHHKHKIDAPSGTALGLGHAAAAGRGVALDTVYKAARDGHTGARPQGEIGFAVLRGGDVVGEHSVVYAGEGEQVVLTHKAGDRKVFAAGAVRAALWTKGRAAGLYSMKSVLGFAD